MSPEDEVLGDKLHRTKSMSKLLGFFDSFDTEEAFLETEPGAKKVSYNDQKRLGNAFFKYMVLPWKYARTDMAVADRRAVAMRWKR